MSLCKFQAQRTFIWESMLENNINYILIPHLTASVFGLRWFFDIGSVIIIIFKNI